MFSEIFEKRAETFSMVYMVLTYGLARIDVNGANELQ